LRLVDAGYFVFYRILDGGDVYFKGSTHVYDLASYDPEKKYKADNGKDGWPGNKNGAKGKDLILLLPLTTEVLVNGEMLYKIEQDNQVIKALKGSRAPQKQRALQRASIPAESAWR
jgi:GTPase involved in cell partitioning and DNA repair